MDETKEKSFVWPRTLFGRPLTYTLDVPDYKPSPRVLAKLRAMIDRDMSAPMVPPAPPPARPKCPRCGPILKCSVCLSYDCM